jgi:DNA-binding transcriptional ArsR family regulator
MAPDKDNVQSDAVQSDAVQSDAVFKALADPTRRRILRDLKKADLPAGDIASRFPISGPSVSRHLAVLRAAGLVTEQRQANKVIYSLVADRLAATVGSFLAAVCPDELPRPQRKKKGKSADKNGGKDKGKPVTTAPLLTGAGHVNRAAHTGHGGGTGLDSREGGRQGLLRVSARE